MNPFLKYIVLIAFAFTGLAISAQEEGMETPSPKQRPPENVFPSKRKIQQSQSFERQAETQSPAFPLRPRRPHRKVPSRKMADALLTHLRETSPAEAERLEKLRAEDTPAFIEAIHQRLQQRRLETALQNYPQVLDCLNGLSQSEREAAALALITQGRPTPSQPTRKSFHIQGLPGVSDAKSIGPQDPRPAGDAKRDEATFELARAYRKSQDPAERKRLNKEIQDLLEEIFDTREAFQLQQVETIENTLLQLKERLKSRKAHRAEIIESRRRELTQDNDSLSW